MKTQVLFSSRKGHGNLSINLISFPTFFFAAPAFSPKRFQICSGKTSNNQSPILFDSCLLIRPWPTNCSRRSSELHPSAMNSSRIFLFGGIFGSWGERDDLHKRHGKSSNKHCEWQQKWCWDFTNRNESEICLEIRSAKIHRASEKLTRDKHQIPKTQSRSNEMNELEIDLDWSCVVCRKTAEEESISVHDWRKTFLKPYCVVQTFPHKGPTSRFWTNGSKLLLKLFLVGLLLPLIWATSTYWSLQPFELPGPALDWDILTPCPQVRFPRREISPPSDPAICWLNRIRLGIGLFKIPIYRPCRRPETETHASTERKKHLPIGNKSFLAFDPFCFELKLGIHHLLC